MLSGLKTISIYDPATGTVVQLNNISERGKYEKESETDKDINGRLVTLFDKHTLEINCYDYEHLPQLLTWEFNKIKLRIRGIGFEEILIWDEDTQIQVDVESKFKTLKKGIFKVSCSNQGVCLKIGVFKNSAWYVTKWPSDDDVNGLINRLVVETDLPPADYTTSIVGKVQKINMITIPTQFDVYFDLICPASGADILFYRKMLTVNNWPSEQLEFEFRDYADSIISTHNTPNAISTIVQTPSNLYKIRFYITRFIPSSVPAEANFELPFIGIPTTKFQEIYY